MVTVRGLIELREAFRVLAPIELTAVNHDAADGGAVSTNPFGRRVYHYVSAVVEGSAKVSTSAEGIIDLVQGLSVVLCRFRLRYKIYVRPPEYLHHGPPCI